MTKLLLAIVFSLLLIDCLAQDKTPVKFGKLSAEDFKTSAYNIDSNATAIVIADVGSSEIVGNNKGWFSLEYKRFKRMHILKKGGYELADVEIPLYTNGNDEEVLDNLKAYTYNLENGKVVETKLDVKNSVFKDKLSKNHVIKKFTFPAIKEGSIIEFEYKITSDFLFNLQPWEFQGSYPRLWSQYEVSIPEFLNYVFLSQGLQYDLTKTQSTRTVDFHVSDSRTTAGASERIRFPANVAAHKMIMRNVPALKEENFTTTLDNHIAKIEFQLAEYRQPLAYRSVMGNWFDVSQTLLKDEDFGLQLNKDNSWMNDELKLALKNAASEREKAKNIYKYVQTNFTCTNYNRIYADQQLRNILKDKKGSEAEINLLLVAMLRKSGLQADPVILSTRSHGYTNPIYPMMERFNYVVCRAKVNDQVVYLDASRPRLGFGVLHWECYNGQARIINSEASAVDLVSDSLAEKKFTYLMLFAGEKGGIIGSMQQTPGYYESYALRDRIKEKGMDELFKDIKKDFGVEVEITDPKIDSLELFDESIQISYGVKVDLGKEDVIYLNPMFGERYKENPFKSAQRAYPVEMPYTLNETYVLTLDVPEGYEVDELPKSTRVNFDETGASSFEYLIGNSGGKISLRSRIKLTRSYFLPEEYEILREFFNLVVSKQNEQIVFKKKK